MRIRDLITRSAFDDLHAIPNWIMEQGLALGATRWVADIMGLIGSLESLPERCPIAPEARGWEGPSIRRLLAGQYRILFIVEGQLVVVLRVRHAQRTAMPAEELLAALRRGLALLE